MDLVILEALQWMDKHPYLGSALIFVMCGTVYFCVHEFIDKWSPYEEEEEDMGITSQLKPESKSRNIMTHDVQVGLLKKFRDGGTPLIIRLMGGGELRGVLKQYDTFTIEFRMSDGSTACLYKHGIVGFIEEKKPETHRVQNRGV